MARMHSRDRGSSGSTKPVEKEVPNWMRYESDEVEKLVIKLAEEGKSPSDIGRHLKDVYGIPKVKTVTGKKITTILEENDLDLDIPEDLRNLMQKYVRIDNHLENNPQDETAKRGLELTTSKIRRLIDYYKDEGVLDSEWTFDPDEINLYVG